MSIWGATALAFAAAGANVVVADVSEDGNRDTAALIESRGGRALAVTCDVTRAEDVNRLDFAFNNAGVEHPSAPAAEITEVEFNRVVDLNLKGIFLLPQT